MSMSYHIRVRFHDKSSLYRCSLKSSLYFHLRMMFQLQTSKRKKIYMEQITMTHGYLRVVELGVRYV